MSFRDDFMTALKIIELGETLGFVFPDEIISALKLKEGDEFILTEDKLGFRLVSANPEFQRQLEVGRGFMTENEETLRDLAKR
jgi:putative addiction module antidote